MENFKKLGLSEPLIKAIEELKFENPTEIQEKAIPLVLAGKDVLAGAATGSGKTLVFAAQIIAHCKKGAGTQALVLVPTRELCEQVAQNLKSFSKHKPLSIVTVYGGVSINPQIEDLPTADVVVGTPGRILDHLFRKTLDLSKINLLILDEADRMLDMGFIDDVSKIITQCNANRQTMLFSATLSADIFHIAKKFLKNPVEISAESYVDPTKMKQIYYDVPSDMKFSLLVHLLKTEKYGLVMVFCNTQRNTDFVARNLYKVGIHALAIHGGFSQARRTRTMEGFNCGKFCVLVCTDVASRGLDIKNVSHVYNYDAPKDSKDYVHRIGRTARAGKEGKVVNIVSQRDYENFQRVIDNKDIKIESVALPENMEKVMIAFHERPQGFRRGSFGRSREHSGYRRPEGHGGYRGERRGEGRGGYRGSSHGERRDSGGRGFGRSQGRSFR